MKQNAEQQRMLQDVIDGLSKPQPEIHSKYLYDELGSALFEAICVTPEYYITRCDIEIHQNHAEDISRFLGSHVHLIEFGSGAGIKTRLLLQALQQPQAYTPIEISAAALQAAADVLHYQFPQLLVQPLQADYTQPINLQALDICPRCRRRVVYFPGSTIGNFTHAEARGFLQRIHDICSAARDGVHAGLLIGFDLLKSPDIMIPAYADAAGVTAAFNKNLLGRINRELGGDFNLAHWRHEARFNATEKRMESYLISTVAQQANIAGRRFEFAVDDEIHIENSHKYTLADFEAMAAQANLKLRKYWMDEKGWFVTAYFELK